MHKLNKTSIKEGPIILKSLSKVQKSNNPSNEK
jgi:hypothetical protein